MGANQDKDAENDAAALRGSIINQISFVRRLKSRNDDNSRETEEAVSELALLLKTYKEKTGVAHENEDAAASVVTALAVPTAMQSIYDASRSVDEAALRAENESQQKLIESLRHELEEATTAFKTVVVLKNQKIKELDKRNNQLTMDKLKIEQNFMQTYASSQPDKSDELKELRLMMERVEASAVKLSSVQSESAASVIRASFNDISKLTTAHLASSPVTAAGVDWAIGICAHQDSSGRSFLSAFLSMASKQIPRSWSCYTRFFIKLIRQGSNIQPFVTSHEAIFDSCGFSKGQEKYIALEDLMNPSNNFLKDDTIVMEVEFKAYPTNNPPSNFPPRPPRSNETWESLPFVATSTP